MNAPVEAFVRIRLAMRCEPGRFEQAVRECAAVQGAWAVTGDFDYELRLAVPNLAVARSVGFPGDRILLHRNGKTPEDLPPPCSPDT